MDTLLCLCLTVALSFSLFCSPPGRQPSPVSIPARIISLSPSLSRQIADLGRKELLVGVTSFDDYRDDGIELVGTLVQPNLEAIIRLRPDIVFLSGEDGPVQNIDRLENAGVRIHRFGRNRNFRDICDNYLLLAVMLDREREARNNIARYSELLGRVKKRQLPGDGGGRSLLPFSCRIGP